MDLALPDLAVDLGDAARRAMTAAGGVDLARQAADRPALRIEVAEPVVERLGMAELDVRSGVEALAAAAEVCREAGTLAFPFPFPAFFARPPDGTARFVAAVDGERLWADHADLVGSWLVVYPDGRAFEAEHKPRGRNRALGPFVGTLARGEKSTGVGVAEFAVFCLLDSWQILGALEAALSLATVHVRDRRQFGRALAEFQGVQFHVADAEVAVSGLRQLAKYTLCRLAELGPGALVDTLALRTFALESAQLVLSTSQLLHGAVGFCDEHDLGIITASVQSSLRLPADRARTEELLTEEIDGSGFEGLFDQARPAKEKTTR